MEIISICLSDLPKSKITEGNNGKKYINLVVDRKKEPDKYGNTHKVFVNQTQEERQAKQNKIYVGNGKEYLFKEQKPTSQNDPISPTNKDYNDDGDDLPF